MVARPFRSILTSRSVWSAWIEVYVDKQDNALAERRAPYGARGLKSQYPDLSIGVSASRSVWSAWIEVLTLTKVEEK